MKKLSKEILERDAKRDIGAEVLEAIREIKAGDGRRFTVQVTDSATPKNVATAALTLVVH